MGNVGEKIKRAYKKVGVHYTVLGTNPLVSGEYLMFEPNSQVTKPFIREYFLEASFQYDTEADAGCAVKFDDGRAFILMNKTPSILKNTTIYHDVVLYKCNVSGELQRPSGETVYNAAYEPTQVFETLDSGVYATLADNMGEAEIEQFQWPGQVETTSKFLHIPSCYGVQPLDRYVVGSGEYYKVEQVERRRFDQVDVAWCVEDTR